jgi:hypothetical protein
LRATVGIIIAVIIAVVAIVFLLVPRLSRIVQLSHLKCVKCGAEFDYAWIPGGSFTAVRLVNWRYFMCPVCKKWSFFDIWHTRVDPKTHHCDIRIGPS